MHFRQSSRGLLGIVSRVCSVAGLHLLLLAVGGRLGAADLEEIVAAKVIRVGLTAGETPPFLSGPAAGPVGGLEGDFITEVARRMDVKIQWVRTARTPDELIAQIVASQVDVAIGQLTDSLEWAKSVRFTKPYVNLQEVRLVDRLAATRARGASQLFLDQNTRISAVAANVVLPAIQEEFGDRLVIVPNLSAAVDEVVSGRTSAVISDEISVVRWLDANPAAGLRLELSIRRDRRPGLALAVPWKSDDLQAWLNLCIDKCVLDGTLPALIAKHLGEVRAQGEARSPINK